MNCKDTMSETQLVTQLLSRIEELTKRIEKLENSRKVSLISNRKFNKGDKVLVANEFSGGLKQVTILNYGVAIPLFGDVEELYYTVVPKGGWPEQNFWESLVKPIEDK